MRRSTKSPYIIRRVDGDDEIDTLRELQTATSEFPIVDTDDGWWWIAYNEAVPVAYIGVISSTHYPNAGYFTRVGVLAEHRGNGLQARLMRVMERFARCRLGFSSLVSDTTDTVHSANNFIRAGWHLFDPEFPWAFSNTLYWRKAL